MREVIEIAKVNLKLIAAHVADVADDQMCLRPAGSPGHPTWQLGHLCFVRASLLRAFRILPDMPKQWIELFQRGSKPTTDAADYPDKQTLLSTLTSLHQRLLSTIEALSEEALEKPNPVEFLRGSAPTIRMLLTLLLTTHDGYHIGQLAAWRATMNLPGIM
jgi:hypothetical protein